MLAQLGVTFSPKATDPNRLTVALERAAWPAFVEFRRTYFNLP